MPKFKFSATLTKIFSLLLIGYICVLLGQGVYRNYRINLKIESLKEEIEVLKQENQTLAMKIEFYKTDTFKSLEARRRLNMKKPDEKVVILPKDAEEKKEDNQEKASLPDKPNYQLWIDYFKN